MLIVDLTRTSHYPYFVRYQGPAPWPVWEILFLDPAARRIHYDQMARTQALFKPTKLVVGPDECINYVSGSAEKAARPWEPLTGTFFLRPEPWDWTRGFSTESDRLLVPLAKAAPAFRNSEPKCFFAVESEDSQLYIGSLDCWPLPSLRCLRQEARGYAVAEGRTCYLALHDHRFIRFSPNGSFSATDHLPDWKRITHAPLWG